MILFRNLVTNLKTMMPRHMAVALLTACTGLALAELRAQLVISEFMAANSSTLKDGHGEFSDWVEIKNTGSEPVDLAGWHLTDRATDLSRWTFPPVTIAAGDYLVIFASGSLPSPDPMGMIHASFALRAQGEYLALVHPDGITLASEFAPEFPPQQSDRSYGSDETSWGYFEDATPGSSNGPLIGLPNRVIADPPGKLFSTNVSVTLDSHGLPPGAGIRYTLDGSPVTVASALYDSPLSISERSHLRTRVFREGLSGPETNEVYLKADRELESFTSNLPVIILDPDAAVPGTNAPHLVGGNALVFETGELSGRSALSGEAAYAGRSGLRVRGRSSANFPKKQYKFEIWNGDGLEKNASLLGMGGESNWVLAAPYTDKSLIRNALAYATWDQFGWTSVDTRFVEVFLNQDQDPTLTFADDYVGIYVLTEAITIDDDRVDIRKPENTTDAAALTGGFVIETGNADSQQFTTTGSGRAVAHRFKDPNFDQLNTTQRSWIKDKIQHFERALYAPDFHHPVTGEHYSDLTDVASQIDFKIMREWTRNFDGGSQFSYLDRGGKLTMSPVWDYNWALGNVNYAEGGDLPGYRTDGWNRSFTSNVNGWSPWWLRFEEDPDWWQQFIDRWTELRESLLSDAAMGAVIEDMAARLEAEASERNFQRWNTLGRFTVISPPGWQQRETYRSEIAYLQNWLEERSAWIDDQFPTRPRFIPAGGAVSALHPPRLVQDGSKARIYYTIDGSDPRRSGGSPNPAATEIAPGGAPVDTILASATGPVRALRPTSALPDGNDWTGLAFDDSQWTTGSGGVGYENSPGDYASLIGTNLGYFPGLQPTSLYTRSHFAVANPAELVSLTLKIRYDDGFVAFLNGVEIARRNAPAALAWNAAATGSHPGDEANFSFETIPLPMALPHLRTGENVLAIHGLNLGRPNSSNTGSTDSDMLIQAELVGSRISDGSNEVSLQESSVVTARVFDGNEWGAPATGTFIVGRAAASSETIVVSEIHYHPADPTAEELGQNPDLTSDDFEWIEITNPGDESLDLSGVSFENGILYDVPLGTILEAGGSLVIAINPVAFALRYPEAAIPLGPVQGSLSSAGERLCIRAADKTVIADFSYRDDWHPLSDGQGFSLSLAEPTPAPPDYENGNQWGASLAFHGTPGFPNGPALQYSFETWLPRYFDAAEIAAAEVTAPEADDDHDGLPLLVEFALGKDPTLADPTIVPSLTFAEQGDQPALRFSFVRPQGRVGLQTTLETSNDLHHWERPANLTHKIEPLDQGLERVTFEQISNNPQPGRTFARLRFSLP